MYTDEFIVGIAEAAGRQPASLLQLLYQVQYRYSCIPPRAIELLAKSLSLTPAHIRGVIGFYSFLHEQPRGHFDILISDSITDHMLGSRELTEQLCASLGVVPAIPRSDGRVTVATTSCTGMCDQGPAMLVNGLAITRLDKDRIDAIARFVEADTPVEQWPAEFFHVVDNIQRRDILLDNSEADEDACECEAMVALLEHGADTILEQITASGLRGCGGAGFSTGSKWRFCKESASDQRYVVCNADEGEPGTFKDRILLNSYADRVFEGMTLCGGVIGADRGLIYLRGEYRYLRDDLEAALQRRRDRGLLGSNILGQQGFDFDIEIHMGAGAYICGEESSLLESLEGKRGIPRIRPPYPVSHGYLGKPTVINNVETFAHATLIARHGADWFSAIGTDESKGTKLLSISGDCARPGIYEYPFGTSVQQILDDCGAEDVQAVQVAGAAGSTIPTDEFDRCIAFEDIATGGSFMVFDQSRNMLDMVKNFAHFFVHESCGFCTPCRVGGSLLSDLVDKLCRGDAGQYDIEEMTAIAGLMKSASHCGLGTTAPKPVLDMIDKFANVYEAKLKHSEYEPAFDLDAALQDARDITGRDDTGAHIGAHIGKEQV